MLPTSAGLNQRPPGLQSDGASKFQVIKLKFQDIKSKFQVIKSKLQVIKSKF